MSCFLRLIAGYTSGAPPITIRVDKVGAVLLRVSGKWAFWRTPESAGTSWRDGERVLEHCIDRQKIPDPYAILAFQKVRPAGYNPCHAIAPDGTLISIDRTGMRVIRYRPDQTVETSREVNWNRKIERVYRDGAIVRSLEYHFADTKLPQATHSHSFVPFRDRKLTFNNQIRLRRYTDASFQREEPLRAGDKLLWSTAEALNLVDLRTAERQQIALPIEHIDEHETDRYMVTSFDGELAVLSNKMIIDLARKEPIAIDCDAQSVKRIVLTRDRIAYSVWDGVLEAIDLRDARCRATELSRNVTLPIATVDSGILVWSREAWKTIEWFVPSNPVD